MARSFVGVFSTCLPHLHPPPGQAPWPHLPLTVLVWKELGIGSIVFLVGNRWGNPVGKFIVDTIKEFGVRWYMELRPKAHLKVKQCCPFLHFQVLNEFEF